MPGFRIAVRLLAVLAMVAFAFGGAATLALATTPPVTPEQATRVGGDFT